LIEKEKCLPQHVVTVEMNVKYHSSQKTIDLFIVENVSKIINHHNVVEALDLAEGQVMAEMTEVQGLVEVQEGTDQEKCLPQHVVTVEMNVKYHSSQKTIDLFIVENVSKIINKISKFLRVTLKTSKFYQNKDLESIIITKYY
jgi:acyl-coenzyme A thioesterase PaaI-like protein